MFTKPYLCPICGKEVIFISGLIKYLNAYKGHLYLKSLHEPPQFKSHTKKDVLCGN